MSTSPNTPSAGLSAERLAEIRLRDDSIHEQTQDEELNQLLADRHDLLRELDRLTERDLAVAGIEAFMDKEFSNGGNRTGDILDDFQCWVEHHDEVEAERNALRICAQKPGDGNATLKGGDAAIPTPFDPTNVSITRPGDGNASLTGAKYSAWYPIDTAPKDETPVLVLIRVAGEARNVVACGNDEGWFSQTGWIMVSPTHWTPLPSPNMATQLAAGEREKVSPPEKVTGAAPEGNHGASPAASVFTALDVAREILTCQADPEITAALIQQFADQRTAELQKRIVSKAIEATHLEREALEAHDGASHNYLACAAANARISTLEASLAKAEADRDATCNVLKETRHHVWLNWYDPESALHPYTKSKYRILIDACDAAIALTPAPNKGAEGKMGAAPQVDPGVLDKLTHEILTFLQSYSDENNGLIYTPAAATALAFRLKERLPVILSGMQGKTNP